MKGETGAAVNVPPLHLHLFWNLPAQVGNDCAEAQQPCTNPSYNANPYGLGILHGCPLLVVGSCTDQEKVNAATPEALSCSS